MAGVQRRWPYSPHFVRPSGGDTVHTYTQEVRVQKSPDCTTKKKAVQIILKVIYFPTVPFLIRCFFSRNPYFSIAREREIGN